MKRTLLVCGAAFLALACSPLGPRRLKMVPGGWQVEEQTVIELPDADISPEPRSWKARLLGASTWEHFHSFDVGIIEFDEAGRVWSTQQRDLVLRKVREHAMATGATVIVYAHGWHHSARWNDTNLVSFRRVLRAMARQPVGMSCDPRSSKRSHVIGVYLGWRGESVPVPVANLFTIWSRKRVAQKIGGAATDWEERNPRAYKTTEFAGVLLELDKIHDEANAHAVRDERAFTSLVITGHSLGGAMLLSTMQRIVFNKTIDHPTLPEPSKLNGLGDLVVLLNPAVEARRYKVFRAEAAQSTFTDAQRPILLTISSDGDWPNQKALRFARFFPTLFTPARWREWHDSTTALGFSETDISHTIDTPDRLLALSPDKLTEVSFWPASLPTDNERGIVLGGDLMLGTIGWKNEKKINPHTPFLVARSTKKIVPNHSDIFTGGVVSFLTPFVRAAERKRVLPYCHAPMVAQGGAP